MSTEKTNVELKSDREVIITRAFAAPAHLVWEAMSKPQYVRRWYGLKILDFAVCEIDHRVRPSSEKRQDSLRHKPVSELSP